MFEIIIIKALRKKLKPKQYQIMKKPKLPSWNSERTSIETTKKIMT